MIMGKTLHEGNLLLYHVLIIESFQTHLYIRFCRASILHLSQNPNSLLWFIDVCNLDPGYFLILLHFFLFLFHQYQLVSI